MFDGKRESFPDFAYKVKALFFELSIDDVVLQPANFSRLCESAVRKASLRSAQLPKQPSPTTVQRREVRHHHVKHHVAAGDVALEYLPTAEQPADALTKNLDRIKVSSFRQTLLGSD
jgi:hypothetical protein